MSVSFVGGPADGVELELSRAPMFMRIVINGGVQRQLDGTLPEGAVDALDLIGDMPRDGELVDVYELVWANAPTHWHGQTQGGRRTGGMWVSAQYMHRDDVDAVALGLGDNVAWREWATAEGHRREGVVDLSERRRARAEAVTA